MKNNIRATCSHAAAVAAMSIAAAFVGVSLGCGDDGIETIFDGDPQVPPQGSGAVIDAWLAEVTYKGAGWYCEPDVHAARSPSPHGSNKVCSNTKLAATGGTATYPMGTASVKELYVNGALVGHATALKLADGPSDGSDWYYYEKIRNNVVANGPGAADNSDGCAGCHFGAGSDASHSGRDFVYTQVAIP